MGSIRKYVAELIGTMVLVIMGCGTAMTVGCDAALGGGYILTALAFGLAIVALAYSVGNISGCHVNPAVSIAFWIQGDLKTKDFCGYIISQTIGALLGAFVLKGVFSLGEITDMTNALGEGQYCRRLDCGVHPDFYLCLRNSRSNLEESGTRSCCGACYRPYARVGSHPRHRFDRHFG